MVLMMQESLSRRDIQDISNNVRLNPIFEATYRELMKETSKKRIVKGKKIRVAYKGVAKTKGWIKFSTPSQTIPGKHYYQYIKLLDMKDSDFVKDLSKRDVMKLMMSGDIAVHCSCPDFAYRKKYMAYNMGYGIYKEMRFPSVTNPNLEGAVCKHMYAVLSVYMANWSSIYKDYTNSYYFKNRYDD